ncbi:MarR family winged helix-turn-helix transcriptional regulator [Kineococcus sp. SYSU DK003]|uniref:MarR family winged helix-turn-helix transcriptional regulator n=1 Tax=Kineococcus sp. SYSU DK003 TaxID=3383124 RepID=UPI003D7E4B5A
MDLAHELHDLVRTLDQHAERALRPEGLSYHRYVALVITSEHPGLTGRQLARALGISEPSTSTLVRQLVAAGLVHDVAPAGAGNVRRLEVTELGKATRIRCTDLLGAALEDSARRIGLDPDRLAAAVRALHEEVRRPAPANTPAPASEEDQ